MMKRKMRIFTGCQLGEERLGMLICKEIKVFMLLVNLGFLQILRKETKPERIWFGLTEKGKLFVKQFEI